MSTVIAVENLSKAYRLGLIGGGTLREDLSRWWARVRNRPDPKLRIGQEHLADRPGERFWALRDVSFGVQQGEVLGIIGRNGAGKSTLLKVLSQVTAPTGGCARVKGRIASLLEVGTGFHPELTGRENVYLNGAILGMTRREIDRKFDEIVAFSEVEAFIDTPVKRYSSGMYVRLAFAVAAHLEPEILLVDEVLAVGDAAFQRKCLGKMGDAAHEGRTVLFVSHNMAAVQGLCGRAILLQRGGVLCSTDAPTAVARYLRECLSGGRPALEGARRSGDGRARVVSVRVSPDTPRTGLPLAVDLLIDVVRTGGHPLAASVSVAVRSAQEAKVLLLHSGHVRDEFALAPGLNRVVARVDSLPLVAGCYSLNVWVGSGARAADFLQDCHLLTVAPGSLGGGRIAEDRGYPVVAPATWEQPPIDRAPRASEGGHG